LLIAAVAQCISLHKYKQIAHDLYHMGSHPHPRDPKKRVDGYAMIHCHRKAFCGTVEHSTSASVHFRRNASSPAHRKRQALPQCAGPIADGAAWKTPSGYYINARNSQQLSVRFLTAAIEEAFDAWGCALRKTKRFVIGPLLGVRQDLSGHDIYIDAPDGDNVIGLGTVEGKHGTIAITIVWGSFGGPLKDREIVEFKMILDETHHRFGNASVTRGVFDLGSTVTHEGGHAHGLRDIYTSACSHVTMFSSSVENDIKKRTLAVDDIAGIQNLYFDED
jgi:hypothetical protein